MNARIAVAFHLASLHYFLESPHSVFASGETLLTLQFPEPMVFVVPELRTLELVRSQFALAPVATVGGEVRWVVSHCSAVSAYQGCPLCGHVVLPVGICPV